MRKLARADGKKIRIKLIEKELTQTDLANLSGVSLSTVSTAARGGSVREDNAQKIANALGVPLKEITEGKEAR